jgi:hypothetical protein
MRNGKPTTLLYRLSLLGLALTGFAQMPIFKRYYIADIPGLGWLARFHTTHWLHYLFAAVLLGLAAYVLTVLVLESGKTVRLTGWGLARGALLLGLVLTGVFLVIRNFPGKPFAPGLIIGFDIAHLALCVALLLVSLAASLGGGAWLRPDRGGRGPGNPSFSQGR